MAEADTSAPPRLPKPESLEAKFKLATNLPYDRRAKRKHCLVYGFVLDWYYSKYGDALASVRTVAETIKERDPAGRGLYAGDVHEALTDLVAWGYLARTEKGSGRRASRYVPVWDSVCSVRENANASSVRENANTSVRENTNATADSVRDFMNEDPSTLTRSQDPGTGKNDIDCAPPADGLAATASAQEGFDDLYAVYGVKKDKAAARRAYDKLEPSPALHTRMIDAAKAWSAAAGGIERMHLSRWIREERYDEDPKSERKARRDAPFDADNEIEEDEDIILQQPERKKTDQEYIIEKAHIDEDRFGKTLKLMMRGKVDGLCRHAASFRACGSRTWLLAVIRRLRPTKSSALRPRPM